MDPSLIPTVWMASEACQAALSCSAMRRPRAVIALSCSAEGGFFGSGWVVRDDRPEESECDKDREHGETSSP